MSLVTFTGSLCTIHVVLCSKIADVHGIEVHDVRTWNFVYFRKLFRFLLHNTRGVTRASRGHNSPCAESLLGAKHSQQCHKNFFQNSTFASERPQVRIWGTKLVSFPRRHLTSLRPCTSRLSSQNGEICLQKYLPITGKLSITKYLTQNAVDYQNHLTIENNLKVEEKVYCFKNKHNFPSPTRNAWGTRRDKHTQKLESNSYAGTLHWKVFTPSQGHWKWSDTIWKREVCSEPMTKFS